MPLGRSKDSVTSVQATIAVFSMVIGAGILTISREVVEAAGTSDAWLSVIVGSMISVISGVIIVKLCQRYPGKTVFEFSTEVVGFFLGKVISVLLSIYFVFLAAYEARIMAELVSTYLLQETPMKIMVVLFLWVCSYLVVGGINPILKSFEYFFPVIIFLIVAILGLCLTKFDIDNLRPVLGKGIMPMLKGVSSSLLSTAGFEILLVIIAFMKKPEKAMGSMLIGITVVAVINIASVVVSIGVLSIEEIRNLTWPLAELVSAIILPEASLEDFSIFFVVIWLLSIFTTCAAASYIGGLGISQTFSLDFKTTIYVLLPIIYVLSVLPEDLVDVFAAGDIIGMLWPAVGIAIPVVLLIVSSIRGKRRKVGDN
jgi:spore germination protein